MVKGMVMEFGKLIRKEREIHMKANISRIKSMERVFIDGKMAVCIKVDSLMIKSMAREQWFIRMEKLLI